MEKGLHLAVQCPVGKQDCPLGAELVRLRQECARLAEMVDTDSLTGLHNYRHFLRALDREMERTRRTGLPTALIMIDLDHFKNVNDTYGHETGNEVLCATGALWKGNIRKIDTLCRYGGEEFGVILPGTRLHRAVRTAERLRRVLGDSPVDLGGRSLFLTASFGVDVFEAGDDDSIQAFVERVDQFLLAAKAEGRNRVCSSTAAAEPEPTELSQEERRALLGDST